MPLVLSKVPYRKLNSRQREAHNFQKLSAALADYGYSTIRLQDDWQGADLIAQHHGGIDFLKIQLKSRLVLDKRYVGKDIYVAFPDKGAWYIYEHDALLAALTATGKITGTASWKTHGSYSWPGLPRSVLKTGLVRNL
jgi:hypothetical protein